MATFDDVLKVVFPGLTNQGVTKGNWGERQFYRFTVGSVHIGFVTDGEEVLLGQNKNGADVYHVTGGAYVYVFIANVSGTMLMFDHVFRVEDDDTGEWVASAFRLEVGLKSKGMATTQLELEKPGPGDTTVDPTP